MHSYKTFCRRILVLAVVAETESVSEIIFVKNQLNLSYTLYPDSLIYTYLTENNDTLRSQKPTKKAII